MESYDEKFKKCSTGYCEISIRFYSVNEGVDIHDWKN